MTQLHGYTSGLLNLVRQGDDDAVASLIAHAQNRLIIRARQMLRVFPGVRRGEATEDIAQRAAMRLCQALSVNTPASSRHFKNLLNMQIREELIDLARYYRTREGLWSNPGSAGGTDLADEPEKPRSPANRRGEPETLAEWTEFHELVARLPDEEREVFEHGWYLGRTRQETAHDLGISERTVRRRWMRAKELLARAVPGAHD
jgi:RNA polymerase sigma factor (sigma-70 family)